VRGLSGAKEAHELAQKPQGQRTSGVAEAVWEAGNSRGTWGCNGWVSMLPTRPGRKHRWSFRADADS